MDFVSHILWSFALARLFGIANWPLFVFFAVFPDLLFGAPLAVEWLFKSAKGRFFARKELRNLVLGRLKWLGTVYHVGHSFVTIAVFSLFNWMVYGTIGLPALGGWLMHALVDLFMHKGGVVEAMPLYPLEWKVKGLFHWSEKWFLALNYALLAIVYAWLFFFR